ncbi:MAG: hypothetical protein ACOH5I_14180 [Oligoflexus sp.]
MKKFWGSLLFSIYAPFVFGETNLIDCQGKGLLKTRCSVLENNLTQSFDYELSYDVDFRFHCPGHRAGIGFLIDHQDLRGPFYSSQDVQSVLTLNTREHLKIAAMDADSFYRAQFSSCQLEILTVRFQPSFQTIQLWQQEANYQAKLIEKSIDAYILARDLQSYQSWDRDKTMVLLEAVTRKWEAFQDLCDSGDTTACRSKTHFQIIHNSLKAKLDSTPVDTLPSREDFDYLYEYYFQELQDEVRIAHTILERYRYWQLELDSQLEDIMANLPLELRME